MDVALAPVALTLRGADAACCCDGLVGLSGCGISGADRLPREFPLFQNFPLFIVIHTVKGFGIANKAEVDVFCNSLAFSMI